MKPTPREEVVLRLLAEGWSPKEIAFKIGKSIKTVESQKSTGMARMGMRGRVDLVRYALKHDWLVKDDS